MMNAQPSRHRAKWSLDFTKSGRAHELSSPAGYSTSLPALHAEAQRAADPALRAKRSWDMALGPIKQVPMNLFIMYMSGENGYRVLAE